MKKLLVILMMLAMACTSMSLTVFAEETPFFGTADTIVTADLFDEDVSFEIFSDSFKNVECEHPGTVEFVHYTTDVYEDGVTYDKWCRVYLPYGYDPEDKDTKYNVLYFQHGNNSNPNVIFDHPNEGINGIGGKNLIDNLLDPEHGVIDPCIIISTTYYFHAQEDMWNTPPKIDQAAGDGRYEGIVGNYYRELIEDIIPQVESQYNVYCEDFSEEGIIASREHRAYSGYSRGAFCTWYMFHHNLPYIKYWMPLSGSCAPDGRDLGDGMATTPEDAYNYAKETIDANQEYDFFIYTSLGGETDASAIYAWIPQMTYFAQQKDTFSFGRNPAENNFYAARNEFAHNDMYMPYSLYNVRDILFK